MTSLSDSQSIDLSSGELGITSQKLGPGSPIQACPHCEALFDITEREPLEIIECPGCNSSVQVTGRVDHFQIIEEAGRGGMGIVYKAYDQSLDRYIAIKLLRKDHSEDARLVAQLEAEAAMTASINDPNVVRVFGTGTDRGRFYLAMELVDKGSLDDLIRIQGRVAERQILEVGIQIARGLQAAHQHGLIHRDVKPGNILFLDANTAKIVDFGLAIFLTQEEASRGEIWGTPYYVAPEKLDHQPEDFRSDMYSLGGTLFHALAGRPPFEAETASLVALKHLKQQPVSLQAFAPWVSNATAHIINRMLNKDPDERYQSYDELIANLEYALGELLRQGEAPRVRQRVVLETEADQKTISWIVLGALVTALLLLTGFFISRPGGGAPVSPRAAGPARATATAASPASVQLGALEKELDALIQANASAPDLFHAAAINPKHAPTDRAWAQFLEGVAYLTTGKTMKARKAFEQVAPLSSRIRDERLGEFLRAQSSLFGKPDVVLARDLNDIKPSTHEAIALLVAGLHDWQLGRFDEGVSMLREFRSTTPTGAAAWIGKLKPLATRFIEEFTAFNMRAEQLKQARTVTERAAIASDLRKLNKAFARRAEEALAPYAKEIAEYAAEAAKPPTSGLFRIVNKNSGRILDVEGFRTNTGAKVVQWSSAGGLNQIWEVIDLGSGLRRLRPTHSEMSLDVPNSSKEAGASIQIWAPNESKAQRWRLEPAGDGFFKIRSAANDLLLAIRNASQENAAPLIQMADTGSAETLWRFERTGEMVEHWQHCEVDPANSRGTAAVSDGVFTIRNKSTDIWGNADSFSFLCQNVAGDFEFTARIMEVGATHEWSKAGVTARTSLNPNERNISVVVSAGRVISHQRRLQNGGESTSTKLPDQPAPHWVKLVRQGEKLTSFHSTDGALWTELANDKFTSATGQLIVGLCVTSHDPAKETVARFDNVRLTQVGK